ncbi:hypothetical protein SIID45300_01380 [Candidatus Magnetaquicoccaceae bacterium FCR-1]|uniref:Adenylate cyclase n=1 Tax=Candidatus Magnetaquiglobus chichijimensis TaxID=3141448 RepID=A0ABQ0C838_9PROT
MNFETIRLRVNDAGRTTSLVDHPAVRAAVSGKARVVERVESLFDTPDLRLTSRGVRLTAWRLGGKWMAGVRFAPPDQERAREWGCGDGDRPDWSELKRQVPEMLLEGVKGKGLVSCFTVASREERWRLEYPDGTRIVLREVRGLTSGSWGEESWHEVALESESGVTGRSLQTALALARHGEAGLEPFSAFERGVARLDPGRVVVPESVAGTALAGERLIDGLIRLGWAQLVGVGEQLAPLHAGSGARAARAAGHLSEALGGLGFLVTWWGEFLPLVWQREMLAELAWARTELDVCRERAGLLEQLRAQSIFITQPEPFSSLIQGAESDLERALQRARQAMGSVRFARLVLGMAIWLHGAEGVRAAAVESDAAHSGRLDLPVEGMARELMRGLHRAWRGVVKSEGEFGIGLLEPTREFADSLLALEQAVIWFGGLFAERKAGGYCAALDELAGATRMWRDLEARGRGWRAALAGHPHDARLSGWLEGWHAARLEGVIQTFRLARERFLTTSAPFIGRE